MTDTPTADVSVESLRSDPDARFELLVERGVLRVYDDDTVSVTVDFENHRGIYVDTYGDAPESTFHETVADLFDLSPETAAARVEELGLTRWELATYLTVREYLDVDLPTDVTLELASMVATAGEPSPIPPDLEPVADESYEPFLAEHPDAVVFVLQLHCAPCERLKDDLPAVRAAAPEGVAFAGLDGDESTAFRKAFEVDTAPTAVVFADGEFREKRSGYAPPEAFAEWFADCYESV